MRKALIIVGMCLMSVNVYAESEYSVYTILGLGDEGNIASVETKPKATGGNVFLAGIERGLSEYISVYSEVGAMHSGLFGDALLIGTGLNLTVSSNAKYARASFGYTFFDHVDRQTLFTPHQLSARFGLGLTEGPYSIETGLLHYSNSTFGDSRDSGRNYIYAKVGKSL